MFLTSEELFTMTGYKRPADQCKWLLRDYLRAWNALAEFGWDLCLIRMSPDGIVSVVDFSASEMNMRQLHHLNFLSK